MILKGEIGLGKEIRTTDYDDADSEPSFVLKGKTSFDSDLEVFLKLTVSGEALKEFQEQLQLSKARRKITITLSPSPQTMIDQHFSILSDEKIEEARKKKQLEDEEKQHKKKKKQQASESKKIDDLEFLPEEEESKKDESL